MIIIDPRSGQLSRYIAEPTVTCHQPDPRHAQGYILIEIEILKKI